MSTTVSWVPVVREDDVAGPPWPCHDVDGVRVRLVRGPDGRLHAVEPRCPHLQSPLDHAEVEGDVLLCPRHWYGYELATGANVVPGWRDHPLAVHPVRVVDGVVEVGREPRS